MPSVTVELTLPRSLGGKRLIKAFAQAFEVQGSIKRITDAKCFLQAEATKKDTLVSFFGSLLQAFEDREVDFDVAMDTFSNHGRRQCKTFNIIESQEWKKSVNIRSSSFKTLTADKTKVGYQNVTKLIEQKFESLLIEDSEVESGSTSSLDKSYLKHCYYKVDGKIIIEVLVPGVPIDCIRISRLGHSITIETLPPKRIVTKEFHNGFRYVGNTSTVIRLPRQAGKNLRQTVDLGILTMEIEITKLVSEILPISIEECDDHTINFFEM